MYRRLPSKKRPLSLSERLLAGVLSLAIGALVIIQFIVFFAALLAVGYFLFQMEWAIAGILAAAWLAFFIVAEIVSRIVLFFLLLTVE